MKKQNKKKSFFLKNIFFFQKPFLYLRRKKIKIMNVNFYTLLLNGALSELIF